jgi:hypothetical protein
MGILLECQVVDIQWTPKGQNSFTGFETAIWFQGYIGFPFTGMIPQDHIGYILVDHIGDFKSLSGKFRIYTEVF